MQRIIPIEVRELVEDRASVAVDNGTIVNQVVALTGWGKTKAREVVYEILDIKPAAKKKVEPPVFNTVDSIAAGEFFCDGSRAAFDKMKEEDGYKPSDIKIDPEEMKKLYEWDYKETIRICNEEKAKQELINELVNTPPVSAELINACQSPKEEIEDCGTHTYNHSTSKYIWQLKDGSKVVLSDSIYKAILRDYAAGKPLKEVALKHSVLTNKLAEILKKMGVTHDSAPFTAKEQETKTVTELTEEERKFAFAQALEKEAWKATQADATKWRQYEYGTLDPFKEFLTNWQPPVYKDVFCKNTYWVKPPDFKRSFVVGAFDWHFGALAEQRYLFKGANWNIEQAHKAIDKYIKGIGQATCRDLQGFTNGVLLLGGDLYNSLTGFTSNGTQLLNEVGKDTQFEAVMNAIIKLINAMLELFPTVECHFVRGNHGGTTDIPLGWAVKNYYRTEKRLNFEIASQRVKPIKVGPVLIMLEHGASDAAKSLVPGPGKGREAYIQSLFLAHPELLVGVKQKLFVMGDQHHFEQHEYADFEFIMMGALPVGDQYSDAKGLHNRARQNCLVIGEDGLESTVHIYI